MSFGSFFTSGAAHNGRKNVPETRGTPRLGQVSKGWKKDEKDLNDERGETLESSGGVLRR